MIRHIEMTKLNEIVDGKNRAEQMKELTVMLEDMISKLSGVEGHKIFAEEPSLDPLAADIMYYIDFTDRDALQEFDLDMDHIATAMKFAEHAETILAYDYEL
ncbi:MAG: Dabb family protein [Coriobacteriales bacterium]|jgi:hypothetical protein